MSKFHIYLKQPLPKEHLPEAASKLVMLLGLSENARIEKKMEKRFQQLLLRKGSKLAVVDTKEKAENLVAIFLEADLDVEVKAAKNTGLWGWFGRH